MSSHLLTIDDNNFESEIGSGGAAMLDFSATWCGPCKTLEPIVEQLASEFSDKGVKVGKVDIDQAPDLAVKFGIQGVPTLLFFKDGEVVDRMSGAQPKPNIEEKLATISG
ncbi:MAG: thioredoxin [Planctomycetota bacterium]|nr:thioredoxin [Planctomycetota bacterium]